jgi:hypothetical protein
MKAQVGGFMGEMWCLTGRRMNGDDGIERNEFFLTREKLFRRSVIEAEGKRQALWRLHLPPVRFGPWLFPTGYRGPTPKLPERSRRIAGVPPDDGDFWAVFGTVVLRRVDIVVLN